MSVKLSRYIFRRIGGRIVPIRKGAEAATDISKGISRKALDKVTTLLKDSRFKVTSKMNLKMIPEFSASDAMNSFMKKTGAIRVSKSRDSLMIDPETMPTSKQISTLKDMSHGVEDFYTNNKESKSLFGALKGLKKPFPKESKIGDKINDLALERYGETHNPNIAGYITKKGEMLNFSGGGYGERYLDHRDVSDLVPRPRLKNIDDKEVNRIYARIKGSEKSKRSWKHENFQSYKIIKEMQSVSKGHEDYSLKGDYIKTFHNSLKRNANMGDKNAMKYLRKLKSNRNK